MIKQTISYGDYRVSKIEFPQIIAILMLKKVFIYLFKVDDRRTRGPLILSEEHRNTYLLPLVLTPVDLFYCSFSALVRTAETLTNLLDTIILCYRNC